MMSCRLESFDLRRWLWAAHCVLVGSYSDTAKDGGVLIEDGTPQAGASS